MPGAKFHIFVTIHGNAKNEEIGDATQQYRDDGTLPLREVALETGKAAEQPQHEKGDEPENCQQEKLNDTGYQQHGILTFTGKTLEEGGIIVILTFIVVIHVFGQGLHTILFPQVGLGLVPIVAKVLQDIQEGYLTLQEHVSLQFLIALLGKVVGFLHTQISLLIMRTVSHQHCPVLGIHLEDFRGKDDAGVAQHLANGV